MAKDIVTINLKRHGDGNQVYLNIKTEKGEIVIRADQINVIVGRELPDPFDQSSPVTVWKDA